MERDLRLYCHEGARLHKVGHRRTGDRRRHFFGHLKEVKDQIDRLINKGWYPIGTQFVIIEYSTKYSLTEQKVKGATIIEIINT